MNHWKPAIVVVLAALVAAMLIAKSRAHDAPSGWTYPNECCSGHDCRPAPKGSIVEKPDGWRMTSSGVTVPYDSPKVRVSPDGADHECCAAANFDNCRPLCLFIAPRGF